MAITSAELDFVRDLIRRYSGIVLDADKSYLVEARLEPIASRADLADVSALIARVRAGDDPALTREVSDALTINETSFFRDRYPFEILTKIVVPSLIEKRGDHRILRVWCCAASTGQEPYSIAMLLLSEFPQLASWSVQVLASDICEATLSRAREGTYSQLEVSRGLPEDLRDRFFTRDGDRWSIGTEVRRLVELRRINLIEPWPALPVFDIVFIRNVMIYFDLETKQSILGRLRLAMRSESALFLGGAETTLNVDDGFESVATDHGAYHRLRR